MTIPVQLANPMHRTRPRGLLLDSVAFIVAFLICVEVDVGGRLFISELVAAFLLPFVCYARGQALLKPPTNAVIALSLAWLSSLVLTDLIRGTAFVDYSRGWAKILFFLVDFVVLFLILENNRRRWAIFGVGLALGLIVDYIYAPSDYARTYPWKFGVGFGITCLIVLTAQWRRVRAWISPAPILAMAAGLNIYLGFRSLGLVCALTAFFLLMHGRQRRKAMRRRSAPRYVLLALIAIGFTYGLTLLYGYSASSGLLGEEEQRKYAAQSSGKAGILLGGRNELLASSQAIADSPVIGHGSWARDPQYSFIAMDRMADLGYEVSRVRQDDLIPTHSYIFGSWVEAGLAGGLFWMWVFTQILRFLKVTYESPRLPDAWPVFCTVLLAWNVLFSPFGAEQRILSAYHLAIIAIVLRPQLPAQSFSRA